MNTKSISRVSSRITPDRSRPHKIVGAYREDAAVIRYRYTDNGEEVSVPNTWSNRPAELKLRETMEKADAAEKRASALAQNPPKGINPEAIEAMIAHHRNKAARLRSTTAWYHSPSLQQEHESNKVEVTGMQ